MKKILCYLWLTFVAFCTASKAQTFTGQANAPDARLALWYRTPATDWMTSALPIGNGSIGAMIFGGVAQEHVQFNDKTLWTGNKTNRGAYQNFGDIYFDFPNMTNVANYRRQLDLENAISTVSYEMNGVTYTREYFCSYPDHVIIMRFSSTGTGNISFDMSMQDAHTATPTLAGKKITIAGNLTLLSYEAILSLNNEGGTTSINGNKISVSNANAVTVILSAGTNYDPVSSTYVGFNASQLHSNVNLKNDQAAGKSYSTLRNTHVSDYQSLFNRVKLSLNDTKPDVPTNELRNAYNNGAYKSFLDILYFQYGRYLMISSARGIALPSNLQGLWCNSNTPPWEADIHSNINVQMNYWPAEITNLSELHATFNDYIYNEAMVQPSWRAMATSTGNTGWALKTQNNIFGYSDWEWNRPANAWFCMHLWQHYTFTLDQDFLSNKAYPVMKSACDFWLSRLITDGNGKLVAPNEWSPEHGPHEDGIAYAQQLIWDLFTNTIKASEKLGIDATYRATLQAKLALLDNGIVIGSRGQLREWKTQDDDPNEKHRHLSNFIALYPGKAISPLIDQTNANAAKIALTDRGDNGQSWSSAWKISAWSRLLDGNHAHNLVKYSLLETYDNLFSVGPPFQIDGNFGTTAGITEMLLQSHLNKLQILPAIPNNWPIGNVSGLKAMGNFTVSLNWNSGGSTTATIYSGSGSNCTVYYKDIATATVKDGSGHVVTFTTVSPNEISFPTSTGTTYTISDINFQLVTIPNAIQDGVYKIVSRRSDKAITVVNNASTDGSNLEQRTFNGATDDQLWIVKNIGDGLVKIANKKSGKVMQVADASTANGAAIQIGTYNTLGNQHFALAAVTDGYFRITPSQNSGKAIDVNSGSSADGATLIQWSYGGGTNQQWKFEAVQDAVANGTYKIVSRRSNKLISVANNANSENAPLEQRTDSGSGSEQCWTLTNIGGGLVKFTNAQSGKAIQIANASTSNSAAAQIGTYSALDNQHFILSATNDGYFRITPLLASDKALEVNQGSSNDGATLAQYTYSASTNQQWKLELIAAQTLLPVKLSAYSVKIDANKNVSLQWATATEINNDYFVVEKSTDGQIFQKIGNSIPAKGNASHYATIDRNIAPGKNYYRLTQVDKNGYAETFPVKSINYVFDTPSQLIFPNPLKGNQLHIKYQAGDTQETVEVFNLAGTKILSKNLTKEADGHYLLNFDKKPEAGIYLLKIGDTYIGKLIVP